MRLAAALFLALLSLPALMPLPAAAQQLIGSYHALLGPQDHVNSNGVRLTDFGAILQQDRANFHRFGRADGLDQWDPVFADPAQRARIPSIWTLGPSGSGLPAFVSSGNTSYVYVEIYGTGGVPQYIVVHQGAG